MLLYANINWVNPMLLFIVYEIFVLVSFVGCYRCEDDSLPSINWVLDLARAAVLRHGVRGLVIDPYNELDHQRPVSQ